MSAATLSVCVPNFNHGHYLPQALRSVLDQSFQPEEILVLDDASTDDSWQLIERFARDERCITPMRNPENLGVIGSLNRLLREARGEYVHFLAADDFLLPGFYDAAMRLLARYAAAGLCGSRFLKVVDNSQTLRPDTHHLGAVWGFSPRYFTSRELVQLPSAGYIYGNTIVINRAALIEAGGYRPELRWHTDWFANWVVAMRYGMCFQPEPLAVYRLSDGQYSRGRSGGRDQHEVIRMMLLLLKTPAYSDVQPAFRDSGIMALLDGMAVACTVMETPDLMDEETRRLVWRLWERQKSSSSLERRLSNRDGQYSEEYLRPRVRTLVGQWKARNARVVIYGAGEHTANLFKWTDLNHARIVGLVDSNVDLKGRVYWSLAVTTPDELRLLQPDVVLISSASAQDDMYEMARMHVHGDVEIVRLYNEVAREEDAAAPVSS